MPQGVTSRQSNPERAFLEKLASKYSKRVSKEENYSRGAKRAFVAESSLWGNVLRQESNAQKGAVLGKRFEKEFAFWSFQIGRLNSSRANRGDFD
jgi:hypothetical protein